MRRLRRARRELSIRGRIIEFCEMWSKFKKLKKCKFCEFGEFRQKLKNLEFRQKSVFWESLGAIWIDSMSFHVVPPLSTFFIFFNS